MSPVSGASQQIAAFVESQSEAELFDVVSGLDLEGVVAKRRDEPYTSQTQWVKVKNRNYSQAVGRWRFFQGRRARCA